MKSIKTIWFTKRFTNMMALFAVFFVSMAANSRCVCIYHQPETPEGLEKYRKF